MIYLTLFLEFLKIGFFTIGGGYAMIPLVKEVVLRHGWMDESQFLNMIGISEVTPGPIAINMATYVGNMQGGILGSILATVAVILPAFLIMLIISIILKKVSKNRVVQKILFRAKPVGIALIASAGITLFIDVLFPAHVEGLKIVFSINKTAIFVFMLIAFTALTAKFIFKKKIRPVYVVILSAVIGLVAGFLTNLPV